MICEYFYSDIVCSQNICRACRSQAASHVSVLLHAGAASDSLALPPLAAAALMRALAAAIGRLPPAQLAGAMREAVGVQIAGLAALLKAGREVRKGSASDPAVWLDRVAALFRDVDVAGAAPGAEHPCVPALSDAWPVLQDALARHTQDARVCERWCRCVRFALRMCGARAAPLAPALAARLRELYAARPHSCVLYLASVLLDELAATPDAVPHLVALLQDIMPQAFRLLQPPDALKENPDTVDDLFRLCIRH